MEEFRDISERRRSPGRGGRRASRRERDSASSKDVGSKQKRRGRPSPRRDNAKSPSPFAERRRKRLADSSSSSSSAQRRHHLSRSRRRTARSSQLRTSRSRSRSLSRSRSVRYEDSSLRRKSSHRNIRKDPQRYNFDHEEGDEGGGGDMRRRKIQDKRSNRRRQRHSRPRSPDDRQKSRHRHSQSGKNRKRRRRRRHGSSSSTPSSDSSSLSSSSSSSISRRNRRRSRSPRRAPAQARRAGVVSDDEPAYGGATNSSNSHRNGPRTNTAHHTKTRTNLSLPFSDTPKTPKESQSNHYHRQRNAPAHSDTSRQRRDDAVGHFEGRKGTIIADRYKIIREVGLGTFGRVVECLDLKRHQPTSNQQQQYHTPHPHQPFVALKIVRNIKRYYESALVEARIVQDLNRRGGRGRTHCVLLYDAFSLADGHYCMVFESLGPSLFDFLKQHDYQPFPMICVQDFAVQLLQTLEFLHSFSLIHTDLKIENILLMNDREVVTHDNQRVPESTRIKLIDFGGACYDSDKKSSVINTRQYRAPEVILGTGWSMPSDMWSVGCILVELYQGELLFATHSNVEHLALMERIIGPFPRRMIQEAKGQQQQQQHGSTLARDLALRAFDSTERHRMERVLDAGHADYVRHSPRLETLIGHHELWFLDLLRMILVLDPQERATAHDCLQFLSRIRRNEVHYG